MSDKVIVQSVSRAVDIITCFENQEEISLTELSDMINLHKSTTYGLVNTLQNKGLLEKNPRTNKYSLGIKVFHIGNKVKRDLRSISYPCLNQLVKDFQETANLVVLDDLHVTYLEKVESTQSIKISTSIGSRQPVHCTSVGKAILANFESDEKNEIIAKLDLIRYTKNTITDKQELIYELDRVKETGIAYDNEEFQKGLICIASPIFNHIGRPIAAISLSGPSQRMTKDRTVEIGTVLRDCTYNISRQLGFLNIK